MRESKLLGAWGEAQAAQYLQKKHYKLVRKELDGLYVASNEYSPNVYQHRNQLLVDHASMVIAVFNGDSGGTFNTIRYAQKKGTKINITEVWTNEKSI